MNRKQIIVILLVVLISLTAVAAVLLLEYQNNVRNRQFPFSQRPNFQNPADIELYYMGHTVLSTINIVLTVILIINYLGIYQKTRSQFTIGLLLFAVMFLIKDLTTSPFVIVLGGFSLFGLGPFAVIPDLFEMAALLVLFYLSVRY
jgi:tryptophan-rich sensory protein